MASPSRAPSAVPQQALPKFNKEERQAAIRAELQEQIGAQEQIDRQKYLSSLQAQVKDSVEQVLSMQSYQYMNAIVEAEAFKDN